MRATEAVYEDVRHALDDAWGRPNGVTCIAPASVAPRDSDGWVLFCDRAEFFAYEAVSGMLPGLLESGAVQEITLEQYLAAVRDGEP